MSLSQESINKGQINGAYSAQFQVMEHERLRRLQEEHLQTTVTMRSRAQVLSKQTIQRKRALEQKKQAMARAEEERRRKALEERRKSQQEATDRFRNAIYRNFRPQSSTYSKSLKITPSNESITRINSGSSTNSILTKITKIKPTSKDDKMGVVINHVTSEINGLHHSSPSTSTPVPNLDEVLDSIRGNKRNNFEEDSLSPIHIQPSFIVDTPTTVPPLSFDQTTPNKVLYSISPSQVTPNPSQTTPLTPTTPIAQATPISDNLEESTISSTSSSLHDSLDTPPLSPGSQEATPMTSPPPTLDLSKVVSPSPETTPLTTPQKEEKRLVGILKKHSDIIEVTNSSGTLSESTSTIISRGVSSKSNSSVGKKVRFVDECCKKNKKSSPKKNDGFMTMSGASGDSHAHLMMSPPKFRISLGGHTQKLTNGLSSHNNNKIHHKNGIICTPKVTSPPTQTDDTSHAHSQRENRLISSQLLTLPIDKTVLDKTPTDEEINELWKHINSYLHHTKVTNEDMPTREVSAPPFTRSIRCRNSHQPVKLWRRHSPTQQVHEDSSKQVSSVSLNEEEHRLMESIEVLNEKLRGRVVTTETLNEGTTELKKITSSRSLNDLPRTRVRYHPKTVLQTTPTSTTRQILQYR